MLQMFKIAYIKLDRRLYAGIMELSASARTAEVGPEDQGRKEMEIILNGHAFHPHKSLQNVDERPKTTSSSTKIGLKRG